MIHTMTPQGNLTHTPQGHQKVKPLNGSQSAMSDFESWSRWTLSVNSTRQHTMCKSLKHCKNNNAAIATRTDA